jgi:serine/threonine-protein kinase
MAGRTVAGKYELLSLLGEGGMGAVYYARHLQTLKRCAVKLLLSPELAEHPGVVRRFFREAKASGVVESDNIVQVFDSGTDESGLPFMVMELLHGEDVDALRLRLGAISPRSAAKLVAQAAAGLAKAHAAGIIHRDIKPANIFLARRDDGTLTVKLLDFGIAKVKMESLAESGQGLTKSGSLIGTPLYMSPEQARGKADLIDGRTDIWSLGAVLYVLLVGRAPYQSDTLGDLMVEIIAGEPPRVHDRAPWVPAELADVVRRCMTRDLALRVQSADALRDELLRFVGTGSGLHETEIAPVSDRERSIPPGVADARTPGVTGDAAGSPSSSTDRGTPPAFSASTSGRPSSAAPAPVSGARVSAAPGRPGVRRAAVAAIATIAIGSLAVVAVSMSAAPAPDAAPSGEPAAAVPTPPPLPAPPEPASTIEVVPAGEEPTPAPPTSASASARAAGSPAAPRSSAAAPAPASKATAAAKPTAQPKATGTPTKPKVETSLDEFGN